MSVPTWTSLCCKPTTSLFASKSDAISYFNEPILEATQTPDAGGRSFCKLAAESDPRSVAMSTEKDGQQHTEGEREKPESGSRSSHRAHPSGFTGSDAWV